jgi:glutathione S-transferase
MVLTLFGSPMSTCTKRVAMVLHETNTPFKFVHVDLMKGGHKAPGYVAQQPFGQVPYIVRASCTISDDEGGSDPARQDDDGFVLYESRAIARYIAAKAKSPLLPTGDARKAALFEQAESIEVSNFTPSASGITFQRVVVPRMGRPTDEALVAALAKTLEGKLAGYEAILSKQKYLAGDEITLADLSHLPHGAFMAQLGFNFLEDEAKFPHVARCASSFLFQLAHSDVFLVVGGKSSRCVRRGWRSRMVLRSRSIVVMVFHLFPSLLDSNVIT